MKHFTIFQISFQASSVDVYFEGSQNIYVQHFLVKARWNRIRTLVKKVSNPSLKKFQEESTESRKLSRTYGKNFCIPVL